MRPTALIAILLAGVISARESFAVDVVSPPIVFNSEIYNKVLECAAQATRLPNVDQDTELTAMLAEKKIEIKVRGAGIRYVDINIRRLTHADVNVVIPSGTFFVSQNAAAQNMVATREVSIRLNDDSWHSLVVAAACANKPKVIPKADDNFTAQRSPRQEELRTLMPMLNCVRGGAAIEQAAVWIVTDNSTFGQMGSLVSTREDHLGVTQRVINRAHAAYAMKICQSSGIDITKKAIWQDRRTIATEVADTRLREWLQRR